MIGPTLEYQVTLIFNDRIGTSTSLLLGLCVNGFVLKLLRWPLCCCYIVSYLILPNDKGWELMVSGHECLFTSLVVIFLIFCGTALWQVKNPWILAEQHLACLYLFFSRIPVLHWDEFVFDVTFTCFECWHTVYTHECTLLNF